MCSFWTYIFESTSWHTSFPPWTKSQAASRPSWGTKDLSDSLHMEIKQLFTGHKLTLNLLNICKYMCIYLQIYIYIFIFAYFWLYQVASPHFLNETNHNPKMLSDFRMHLGFIQPTKIHPSTFAFPEPFHFHRFHRKPSNRQTPSESNLPEKNPLGKLQGALLRYKSCALFFSNRITCTTRIHLKKLSPTKPPDASTANRPLAPTPKKHEVKTHGSFIKA